VRVGIQTWGTEGDVRPFFALAQSLSARGHTVRLVYTSVEARDFSALGMACGVDARHVGREYFIENRERLDASAAKAFAAGGNPLKQVRVLLRDMMDPVIDAMLAASEALAADSDVVVGHFMTYAAAAAARKHGKPFVPIAMQPFLPSKHYPPPVGIGDLGRFLNPLLWKVFSAALESALADRVNAVRSRCGLGVIRGLQRHALDDVPIALIALSPSLFPRPPDWDARIHLSGFLRLPEAAEPWDPEPSMKAFLAAAQERAQRR
jgi:UDP:flavonoid glycosyltransferase YjiC (YdhE family)